MSSVQRRNVQQLAYLEHSRTMIGLKLMAISHPKVDLPWNMSRRKKKDPVRNKWAASNNLLYFFILVVEDYGRWY